MAELLKEGYNLLVEKSTDAQKGWLKVPAPKRGELIRIFGNKLREHLQELGKGVTMESKKILVEGVGEVQEVIDMCAAPGGKSLQALSSGAITDLIEISPKRSIVLRNNLNRLNYKNIITTKDALKIPNLKKYDYVLIDSPCSSIGTIRRHPEIFFRKSTPNLEELLLKQEKLLNKAKHFLKKNGKIIYMVCSFLPIETTLQINKFLNKNTNFSIDKFILNSDNKDLKELIDNNGYIKIVPKYFKKFNIDGFFAAKLIKND